MRVGELAARTGVSVRSLRYYEQQGLLDPRRTPAGHRVYTAEHETAVHRIQELFKAGFCSSVVRDLLPALTRPERDADLLRDALAAARARLESERDAIETELTRLAALRDRLGLAPDTRVTSYGGPHERLERTPPTPSDHRDRRLR